MTVPIKVFAAPGSEDIVEDICTYLQDLLADKNIKPGEVTVTVFDNDNLEVQVEEVRGCFVVVVSTQAPPVSQNLVALLLMLDAIQNASAYGLFLLFPYMFLSRSDRKNKSRISVGGPLLARIINRILGVKKVVLLDTHDEHTRNVFEPSADGITAVYLLADYLKRTTDLEENPQNYVLVFADAGSAKRFEKLADFLGVAVAYIDKKREVTKIEIKQVVGEIKDKICVLVDDEALTGTTGIKDCNVLISEGAKEVIMMAVHGPLCKKGEKSDFVIKAFEASVISRVIVTDSIPLKKKLIDSTKFEVVSVAKLLAEVIKRVYTDKSLSHLHKPENVRLYRPDLKI